MGLDTDQAKCSIGARLCVLAVVLRNKGLFIWQPSCFHSSKLEASLAAANRLVSCTLGTAACVQVLLLRYSRDLENAG